MHHKRTGFLVPNEQLQQIAGQRQDRRNEETGGRVSYQHVLSSRWLGEVQGMVRNVSARLWSNPLATPIVADQDRGFRENYFAGSLSGHLGTHELKAGSEIIQTTVREQFAYKISTGGSSTRMSPAFPFRRPAARSGIFAVRPEFVQNLIRAGRWTLSAGLRWDRYRLLVRESAFSPRLGLAWHWPSAGVVFHASYDRVFQIPAIENLLLASSEAARHLTEETTGLPVPPSRGNFYEAGFSKNLFGKLRLDANYFRRNLRNFADDDLLLDTGVSFPIAFSRAKIYGFERTLEVPSSGPFSGFLSYSNLPERRSLSRGVSPSVWKPNSNGL